LPISGLAPDQSPFPFTPLDARLPLIEQMRAVPPVGAGL